MKLIIDIDEEVYNNMKSRFKDRNETEKYLSVFEKVGFAVKNGTPLPKGHGDLVDRDAINSRFYDIWEELESYSNKPSYKELLDRWGICMDIAQPIIKADEEDEE